MKEKFDFGGVCGINSQNSDELLWRHWLITFAVKYPIKFTKSHKHNFVECGVGSGMSAFFALKEIKDALIF